MYNMLYNKRSPSAVCSLGHPQYCILLFASVKKNSYYFCSSDKRLIVIFIS